MKRIVSISAAIAALSIVTAKADTLADWTFDTAASTNNIIGGMLSPAATQSGVFADFGSGTASASHASATTAWSVPAGNGSPHSWSANYWNVGDYYQFQVNTLNYSGVNVSFDQTSSSTGPGAFRLSYSTDGVNFSDFITYTVLVNGAPNTPWSGSTYNSAFSFSYNLSAISALNNQATVFFRVVDNGTVSANGATVATTGTSRLDNFLVTASVPEPTTVALCVLGGLACLITLRRRA